MYEASGQEELNDLKKGWDGTFEGEEQGAGTFFYTINSKDVTNVDFVNKGNITLIR